MQSNRVYWLERAEWWVSHATYLTRANKVVRRADFAYEIGTCATMVMRCMGYAHESAQ